jgi:hypothetical protein
MGGGEIRLPCCGGRGVGFRFLFCGSGELGGGQLRAWERMWMWRIAGLPCRKVVGRRAPFLELSVVVLGLCFCGFSISSVRGDGICFRLVNGRKWVYVQYVAKMRQCGNHSNVAPPQPHVNPTS